MAAESSSNNGFLYFIVGILVVGVGIIAWVMFGRGEAPARSPEAAIERSADALGDAADKVGDAAKKATPDGG